MSPLTVPMTAESIGIENKNRPQALIIIPEFEHNPDFVRRQYSYLKAAYLLQSMLKIEKMRLVPEEKEILERVFVTMSVIDFMIDTGGHSKSEIMEWIERENSNYSALNFALAEIRRLIDQFGDFSGYKVATFRAISYSGKDSVKDRHREGLYLGKAIAQSIAKDALDKAHLVSFLGALTSLVNFVDDVMDYKMDGKKKEWALGRLRAGARQTGRLYAITGPVKSSRHLVLSAGAGIKMQAERVKRGFSKWSGRYGSETTAEKNDMRAHEDSNLG